MLDVLCTSCGEVLRIPSTYSGQKGKCQKCGAPVIVPQAENNYSPNANSISTSEEQSIESSSETAVMLGTEENVSAHPLIDKLLSDYKEACAVIDVEVPRLISEGQEMKSILKLVEATGSIMEIHEALSTHYELFLRYYEYLKLQGSERVRQFGAKPLPTFKFLRETDCEEQFIRVQDKFKELGLYKKHPSLPSFMIAETEYMLDSTSNEDDDEEPSRFIPSSVKLSVWRRDQGKCVHCKSQERLEYDHIIPVVKGGSNTERNIQLLCEKCNREKSARIT